MGATMPQFETFRKAHTPVTREPHVTIQKRGTVTLNAAAYALLGSPSAVELLYDVDEQVLGLRRVSEDVEHAMFVRASTRSAKGPWVISAMAFVHHWAIDTTQARRWVAHLDDDVLLVRLGEGGQVVSKRAATDRPDPPTRSEPRSAHRPRPRPDQRRAD